MGKAGIPKNAKAFCSKLTVLCQMYGIEIQNDPILRPMVAAKRTCQFEYRAETELIGTAPYLRYVFKPGLKD